MRDGSRSFICKCGNPFTNIHSQSSRISDYERIRKYKCYKCNNVIYTLENEVDYSIIKDIYTPYEPVKNGYRAKHSREVKCLNDGKIFISTKQAGEYYGISTRVVRQTIETQGRTRQGLMFKWLEEYEERGI